MCQQQQRTNIHTTIIIIYLCSYSAERPIHPQYCTYSIINAQICNCNDNFVFLIYICTMSFVVTITAHTPGRRWIYIWQGKTKRYSASKTIQYTYSTFCTQHHHYQTACIITINQNKGRRRSYNKHNRKKTSKSRGMIGVRHWITSVVIHCFYTPKILRDLMKLSGLTLDRKRII